MDFRGHCLVATLTFGLFALAAVSVFSLREPSTLMLSFLACVVGANLPDLDVKTSKPHRYAVRATAAATVASATLLAASTAYSNANRDLFLKLTVVSAAALLAVLLISRLPHRGPTHGAPGILAYGSLLLLASFLFGLPPPAALLITLAGVAGYASHILADEASTFFKKFGKKTKKRRGKRGEKRGK